MSAAEDKHAEHGAECADGGPRDADCPCRGTADQAECAATGCGFCVSAEKKAQAQKAEPMRRGVITRNVSDDFKALVMCEAMMENEVEPFSVCCSGSPYPVMFIVFGKGLLNTERCNAIDATYKRTMALKYGSPQP